jgi:hypothetical protein
MLCPFGATGLLGTESNVIPKTYRLYLGTIERGNCRKWPKSMVRYGDFSTSLALESGADTMDQDVKYAS